MGTDLAKGTTYSEGDQVNAANLNAHVDDATLKYTAISSKTLKDPAALGDEILINDAGVFKKITLQQISSLVTIPPGIITDFAGSTAPTGWLLCYGQAISRTTYSALFTAIGTTYGSGDGSSTFALPDGRGRVAVGKDNMGGSAANRITSAVSGMDALTLGAVGGDQHMHSHRHSYDGIQGSGGGTIAAGIGAIFTILNGNLAGTGNSENVQPGIIFNKIIKT